jgi:hypothetical protein
MSFIYFNCYNIPIGRRANEIKNRLTNFGVRPNCQTLVKFGGFHILIRKITDGKRRRPHNALILCTQRIKP